MHSLQGSQLGVEHFTHIKRAFYHSAACHCILSPPSFATGTHTATFSSPSTHQHISHKELGLNRVSLCRLCSDTTSSTSLRFLSEWAMRHSSGAPFPRRSQQRRLSSNNNSSAFSNSRSKGTEGSVSAPKHAQRQPSFSASHARQKF